MRSVAAKERGRMLNVRLQMISRCHNEDDPHFPNYGGRGIIVCDKWRQSAQAFIDDMGPRPMGGTVERIDNDGPYSPENCRWGTRAEQVRNRRNNITVEIDGKTLNLKDACELRGLPYTPIWKRIRRGWSIEDAFHVPLTRANRGEPRGFARTHLPKPEPEPEIVRLMMAG